MFKFFYNKFWYPVFGTILSRFVFLIEGQKKNGKSSVDNSKKIKK